jgi:hypothetical protein
MMTEQYNELAYYTLALKDDYFIHQHIVDAYTVQSASIYTKPISLTFGLVGLYLLIEKGFTGKQIQNFHTLMSKHKMQWPTFSLPENRSFINVEMVLKANEGDERSKLIIEWCKNVWHMWQDSHNELKKVVDYYLERDTKL